MNLLNLPEPLTNNKEMRTSLLGIELIKILKYKSFRVLAGLHLFFFLAVVFLASRINIEIPGFNPRNLFAFPYVWQTVAWFASWFNILLVFIIIMLTCNEFSYNTFRQHIINGLTRDQLLAGKGAVILLLGVYSFLLVLITGGLFGLFFSTDMTISRVFNDFHILLVYFLQTIAYMVIGMAIAILMKGTALSIVMFFLLRILIEPVLRSFFDPVARQYFPVRAISNLTPVPEFLSIASESQIITDGNDMLTFESMGLVSHQLPLLTSVLLAAGYTLIFIILIRNYLKRISL